ncbi:MAG: hypothetical protein IJW29_09760 [Clostridia bacterium]|nr:hypothetical protein [Clostridia bacterium]MBQ9785774.1 hypothetical protein [Clostridia bacterium]
MEISEARITFSGFQIKEFEPSRTWQEDENGQLYTNDPLVIHTGSVARNMLENELRNSVRVMGITLVNGVYDLGACGIDPYFSARIRFSRVDIEWDDYSRKAWYELHHQYQKELTLATENGDVKVDARIHCSEEVAYSVSVVIQYDGKEIWGHGTDYLWTDAFASLQKELPDNVKIHCCLTCRHGNMCPVGNTPGKLFCTKDVVITQKSDLYFYTEDEAESAKRSRDCTNVCDSYQEQTEEDFVYNDYLLNF